MFPVEGVPERIGAYQVQRYLGRHGSADLYDARSDGPLGFSRHVTLKMVRFAVDEDARFAEELAREAAICSRLNHPAIVRMYDFFEHDRRLVLVLEQVEGVTLDRLLSHLVRRKQPLGDGAVFFIAAQIAGALAHAHASVDESGNQTPVIHRDLKPENVVVHWDGNVRLYGFGLGKILGHSPDSVAGTIRGTPGFMSPEQSRGERATVRSDVYGFGALVWALLSGQTPPDDGSRPEPIAGLRPDLPRELAAAVDAALEPSADRRKISCAELAQWLSKLVKAEVGREELKQKALWLRATRGSGGRTEAPKQAPARRRQAIQAMRQSSRRTSTMPPSSRSGYPPSSRRPMSGTLEMESPSASRVPPPPTAPGSALLESSQLRPSTRPTIQAPGGQDGGASLRLPPPPPLPSAPRMRSEAPASPSVRPVAVSGVSRPPPAASRPPRVHIADTGLSQESEADAWQLESPALAQDGHAPTFGAPPPQLLLAHRAAQGVPQQFSLVTQILVAGLTASLVVAIGIIFISSREPAATTASGPPQPTAETTEPVTRNQPSLPPITQQLPPTPTPATPARGPVMPDPSELSDQLGYLMVKGPTDSGVFLNGLRKGDVNETLLVPCGRFFMRLGTVSQGPYPTWQSRGETVFVACKSSTILTVKLNPDESPAPRPPNGMGL